MATTPLGVVSLPILRMRELLSKTAEVQSWLSAVEAVALPLIYGVSSSVLTVTDETPQIIVTHGMTHGRRARQGAVNNIEPGGTLRVSFRALANEEAEELEQYDFTNHIGAIIEEVFELGSTGGLLQITSYRAITPPQLTPLREQDARAREITQVIEFSYEGGLF